MKNIKFLSKSFLLLLTALVLISFQNVAAQQTANPSQPLPDNLSKFFFTNCIPCHTSKGSMMSRSMVNFDDWAKLTADKQSSKADKIAWALGKDKMPPKSAREKRPEIVPTKDQVALVQKWAESLKPQKK